MENTQTIADGNRMEFDPNDLRLTRFRKDAIHKYDTEPIMFYFTTKGELEAWIQEQRLYCNWNKHSGNISSVPRKDKRQQLNSVDYKLVYYCDHHGHYAPQHKENVSPAKQRHGKETIKTNCGARFIAKKFSLSGTIQVEFYWQHNGHEPGSAKDIALSRNNPDVKKWIDAKVSQYYNTHSVKELLRLSESDMAQMLDNNSDVIFASLRVTFMDVYNALRRKAREESELAQNLSDSITLWANKLSENGWHTHTETISLPANEVFIFCATSHFQSSILTQQGSIVSIDATHNVCRNEYGRKMYLTTILGRDSATGCGVPLSFMWTDSEAQLPLISIS
ncbi:uncharacterized protein V1513DRAFT_428285 [Lipomyces chichibuensis]|uniref:uncharacterized protein n=1 Tax=Lipomyces chichibuensis TaxID=1546026 RepID=UPI003343F641